MTASKRHTIRNAEHKDCALICEMIYELADYERLRHEVCITPELLHRSLFGEAAPAKALVAEIDEQPAGYALYFTTFSTFTGRPGIYLEDIYVRSQWRNRGLGKALLTRIAGIALQQGCARMEWSVLDWNQPAIEFYQSLGARPLTEWTGQRLTGRSLEALAASDDWSQQG